MNKIQQTSEFRYHSKFIKTVGGLYQVYQKKQTAKNYANWYVVIYKGDIIFVGYTIFEINNFIKNQTK